MSVKTQPNVQDDLEASLAANPHQPMKCNDTYACAPNICHETKVEANSLTFVMKTRGVTCKALVELLFHGMLYLPRLPSFLRTTSSVYRMPLPL